MTGNLAENFRPFIQEYKFILIKLKFIRRKKQFRQVAIILNLLGTDSLKIYNTFKVKDKTVFEILKALVAYYT